VEKTAPYAHCGNTIGSEQGDTYLQLYENYSYYKLIARTGEGGHGGNYEYKAQKTGCDGSGGAGALNPTATSLRLESHALGSADATSLAFNPYSDTGSSSVTITAGNQYGKGGTCSADSGAGAGGAGAALFFY
jgi:hypothetical protein